MHFTPNPTPTYPSPFVPPVTTAVFPSKRKGVWGDIVVARVERWPEKRH